MTTNAEKLARDLIALRAKYSDRDFDTALGIISSGELFGPLLEIARRTEGKVPHPAKRRRKAVSPRPPNPELEAAAVFERARGQQDTEAFLRRFLERRVLGNGAAIRAFGEILGLRFPNKLPGRLRLADSFAQTLANMSYQQRQSVLEQAGRLNERESSLQQWSDVIVKRSAP
jgi:hypothetical protein